MTPASYPRRLRALLLDLDGTLLDSAPAIVKALNVVLARRGGRPVDAPQVRKWVSFGAHRLVANAFGPWATSPDDDLAEFRSVYERQEADPADLYPGAVTMLSELTAAGLRIAVCTNKPQASARRLIDGLGLARFIEVVVGGRQDLRPKPHPDSVLEALTALQATPDQAIFVGDSEVDAGAAAAAAVSFVLATFGYAMSEPGDIKCFAAIDRLGELPRIVAADAARAVALP